MLYDLYIDSSKSYSYWAVFNTTNGSLLVRPAFAQESDMKDFNITYVAIPNAGTRQETGFQTIITMYNELPTIILNYTYSIIYALQPATVDVLIEDLENNSIFFNLSLSNGYTFSNDSKYDVNFIGTNHWHVTFYPLNTDLCM